CAATAQAIHEMELGHERSARDHEVGCVRSIARQKRRGARRGERLAEAAAAVVVVGAERSEAEAETGLGKGDAPHVARVEGAAGELVGAPDPLALERGPWIELRDFEARRARREGRLARGFARRLWRALLEERLEETHHAEHLAHGLRRIRD